MVIRFNRGLATTRFTTHPVTYTFTWVLGFMRLAWILATGAWNDAGTWDDTAVWRDV